MMHSSRYYVQEHWKNVNFYHRSEEAYSALGIVLLLKRKKWRGPFDSTMSDSYCMELIDS